MSLHINSREHLKQRQEVTPLTMEEEEYVLDGLNSVIDFMYRDVNKNMEFKNKLQDLLYNYENLKHFFIISQSKTANMEVQYEIVESKMNN